MVTRAVAGRLPGYLADLEQTSAEWGNGPGRDLRTALHGDCHLRSDWSDGGSPIETMERTARDVGHRLAVITDHSPGLTVARGLTVQRLREQIQVVTEVNEH